TQCLLSLGAGLGLDLLLLDCGRVVPALRHSQPVLRQPQQGRMHRLVLSAVCGVKTCSCTTPIFLAPTRHNEDPDRHYKLTPPAGVSNTARNPKMAPRSTPGGAKLRGYVQRGSIPHARFQLACVKLVPAHRLNSASGVVCPTQDGPHSGPSGLHLSNDR